MKLARILFLAVATVGLLAVPARAQEPTVEYVGTSIGQSLIIDILGQGLTAGGASSLVDSSVRATAFGAGLANPISPVGISSALQANADGTSGSEDPVCEGELPDNPALVLDAACSSSIATIAGGLPSSASTATIGEIEVNVVGALADTPLADIFPDVDAAIDQILTALSPLLGGLDDVLCTLPLGLCPPDGEPVTSTLGDLFDQLLGGAPLATVTLGDTATTSSYDGAQVTTTCRSEGATIELLNPPEITVGGVTVDPPALVTITVGEASTSVVVDPTTGVGTPVVTPALVHVSIPSAGIDQDVTIDTPLEVPLPEPLGTTTITLAGGTSGVDADGNTFATASAVNLSLLNSEALMGGVEIGLAGCASVGRAALVQTPVTAPPPSTVTPTLPRTGGDSSLAVGAMALAVLALGGFVLQRRMR